MRLVSLKALAYRSNLSVLRKVIGTGGRNGDRRCSHQQSTLEVANSEVRITRTNSGTVSQTSQGRRRKVLYQEPATRGQDVGTYSLQSPQNPRTEVDRILRNPTSNNQSQWRKNLVSFEQLKYESDLETPHAYGSRLVEHAAHAEEWRLWLELIRFRKRHHGAKAMQPLFRELFRKNLWIPTSGAKGDELWDLLIMTGHHDSEFLKDIIAYAVQAKEATGQTWKRMYKSIIAHALKTDPASAYDLHTKLKKAFPPSTQDYQRLFRLSIGWDNVDGFEGLYRDLQLPGMYTTIVPELCKLGMFRHAIRWHNLLFTHEDYPTEFYHVKPLLIYLARIGDYAQIERIISELKSAERIVPSVSTGVESYVKRNEAMSRELLNRHLGEVHGVSPKHFSDSFCARLFATKLFTVDSVIFGLQMTAMESIGPLALRELAARDECLPKSILRHLDRLREAGVTPSETAFSLLIQRLALTGEHKLLKSVVQSDLHPDNFEDLDLQERLLAQYLEKNDQLQFERTLAAMTVRCKDEDLGKWRSNLILRSHITLRDRNAVSSMLETMKRQGIPVTMRSSRHLRVSWLSERNVGKAPNATQELTIIINATISTMESGRFVPIVAWREILRRLGMTGRLEEFENLALWLVDHYTNAKSQQSLPGNVILLPNQNDEFKRGRNPQAYLNNLFTIAAQHAVVAWGFQHEVKWAPKMRSFRSGIFSNTPEKPLWMWGLVLLRRLQERGVPIHHQTVARICKIRLKILFGDGTSRSRINRQLRLRTDLRMRGALDRYAFKYYLKGMQSIWGEDLFWQHRLSHIVSIGKGRRRALPHTL